MTPRVLPGRRTVLAAVLAAPAVARAQAAFTRPMTLIVGFAPGGSIDYVARLVARELGPMLGQTITVDNRPGAGGNLATQAMLRAPPDGHTLGFAGINLATNPAMMNMGYDPRTDLRMLGQIDALPVILITGTRSGYTNLQQLVEAGRRTELPFGSGGVGTSSHLGVALLAKATGVNFTHVVFRGGAPAVQALIAGDTAAMFEPMAPYHIEMSQAGQLRILVTLQDKPIPALPEVPTVASAGYGPELMFQSWHGLMVRNGTPEPIVTALHAALTRAVQSPAVSDALRRNAMEPVTSPDPATFQAFYLSELDRWSAVIREAGISIQ
ncbi:Bug family tripartite tricarboxylate transporter substrate binding protein [Roseomonas sp. CCTCC AB2023176]|uniref:Bug family tripartite tricarboxylate transporter substrate binding protein n=1 Tax=Roseomonas sp. CCTCC AB2023176 TaxID=3342640 RepID=UPI0035E0715B